MLKKKTCPGKNPPGLKSISGKNLKKPWNRVDCINLKEVPIWAWGGAPQPLRFLAKGRAKRGYAWISVEAPQDSSNPLSSFIS